jgi:hypothetical protein
MSKRSAEDEASGDDKRTKIDDHVIHYNVTSDGVTTTQYDYIREEILAVNNHMFKEKFEREYNLDTIEIYQVGEPNTVENLYGVAGIFVEDWLGRGVYKKEASKTIRTLKKDRETNKKGIATPTRDGDDSKSASFSGGISPRTPGAKAGTRVRVKGLEKATGQHQSNISESAPDFQTGHKAFDKKSSSESVDEKKKGEPGHTGRAAFLKAIAQVSVQQSELENIDISSGPINSEVEISDAVTDDEVKQKFESLLTSLRSNLK